MTERIITGLMLIVAIIHLLPLVGAIGVERVNALYATSISDPTLEILMRHRAVMFGILGGFFAYAAFMPAMQPIAFIAAAISVGSFFWFVYGVGDPSGALSSIVIADIVATIALGGAVVLYLANRSAGL